MDIVPPLQSASLATLFHYQNPRFALPSAKGHICRCLWFVAMLLLGLSSPAMALTTYTVNSLADSDDGSCDAGDCTLREAITAANGTADDILIDFAIPGTITLGSALPDIGPSNPLTIDGGGTVSVDANNGSRVFNIALGSVTLNGLTITGGSLSAGRGGGINNRGNLTVIGSTISGNVAPGDGAGIYSEGPLNVSGSTFEANQSTGGLGAAIGVGGGTAEISNATISNNLGLGAAIGTIFSGTITVRNSTLTGNTVGLTLFGGTINLHNTIVANSTNNDCDPGLGTLNISYSLIEDATCPIALAAGTGNLSGDPDLAAATGDPFYFPLNVTSPAIDTGDNALTTGLTTDQAGNVRIQNLTVDMGAVEFASLGCPSARIIPDDRWVQVGIPCDDGTLTVSSVFGDDIAGVYGNDWALWHFDTATQKNTPLALNDAVAVGKGYWLKHINGTNLIIDAEGSDSIPTNGYPLVGAAGGLLNLLGNYRTSQESICWANVQVFDGTSTWTLDQASTVAVGNCSDAGDPCINNSAYRWNGNAYDVLSGATPGLSDGALAVMDSVWVQAFQSGLSLVIPDTGPCPVVRNRLGAGEWYHRLRVTGPDGMVDESNVLGQLGASRDGLDHHDIADLPPFDSPFLTLSFQHPDTTDDLNSDYRGVGAGVQSWDFTVRADIPRSVTLSWEAPYGRLARTILVDLESGTEINPTPGGKYRVTMKTTAHRFQWRVTVPTAGSVKIFGDGLE